MTSLARGARASVLATAVVASPAAVAAQAGAPAPPSAAAPAGAPAAAPASPLPLTDVARRLAPTSLSYRSSVTAEGQVQNTGTRTLRVANATEAGAAAWLLLDGQETPSLKGIDSLFVRATDLAPIRRATRVRLPDGEVVLDMRFTADSVVGSMRMGAQSQTIAMRNAPNTAASDGVLLLALANAPLAAGYVGGLATLDAQSRTVRPITLRVLGREKVTVPAGTYDAWVVKVNVGTAAEPIGEATYYVANGGPVVRMVATSAQMGGARLESVLQAPPAPAR